MFEFSIAKKYLIPRKRQLSLSLIALMSVGVISLIVWLVLVFLSVTEGIETSWLSKLTSLNAPVRLTPTEKYYESYFYQVDSIAEASDYTHKTIGEKFAAELSNPYDDESDEEPPLSWAPPDIDENGELIDPVKRAFNALKEVNHRMGGLTFQEYEVAGALVQMRLLRPGRGHSTVTQVSYLASFPNENPKFGKLILPPTPEDLNNLFYLASIKGTPVMREDEMRITARDPGNFRERMHALLEHVKIKRIKSQMARWHLPYSFLPEGIPFRARGTFQNGRLIQIVLNEKEDQGILKRQNGQLLFYHNNGDQYAFSDRVPLFSATPISFAAYLLPSSLENANSLRDIEFKVQGKVQGHKVEGVLHWDAIDIEIADVERNYTLPPHLAPLWSYTVQDKPILPNLDEQEEGILLAKGLQETGIRVGDRGYISYAATTTSAVQEQRLPVYVAGFYDSGVMSIGSKFMLVHPNVTRALNKANPTLAKELISNGIYVFFDDLSRSGKVKKEIEKQLKEAGIDQYWNVATFHQYDFAKDLLQQFQSDKYLFSLVGIIILIVACSNIISLLVILVNDKRKEIGIMMAMGARPRSIAIIFGLCGAAMGVLSSAIGIGAALITLKNIDGLVGFLSMLQGHEAFNSVFYGNSLPNVLSTNALFFVMIATPLLSLVAGLVPAIKACKLKPSVTLRSE